MQGFTASYLEHYIPYGKEEIRAEIQAVYDSGYDEWLIWNASNNYDFSCFLSKEEAEQEEAKREKERKDGTSPQSAEPAQGEKRNGG